MVNFKEIAKEIFEICTNISKSEGRASEKVEEILRRVYDTGRDISIVQTSDSIRSSSIINESGHLNEDKYNKILNEIAMNNKSNK